MNAFARKEVILAAGAIQVRILLLMHATSHSWMLFTQTPALLQLSGIGDATQLSALGITPLIDLKTVGKNFQEQPQNVLACQGNGFDLGGRGPPDIVAFPNIHELFGDQAGASIAKIKSSIERWAQSQAHNAISENALKEIFTLQAKTIIEDDGDCSSLTMLGSIV